MTTCHQPPRSKDYRANEQACREDFDTGHEARALHGVFDSSNRIVVKFRDSGLRPSAMCASGDPDRERRQTDCDRKDAQ